MTGLGRDDRWSGLASRRILSAVGGMFVSERAFEVASFARKACGGTTLTRPVVV